MSDGLELDDGQWVLHGQLSVRAATRAIAVHVELARADVPELRLRANARVDRYDFGITYARGLAARHLDLHLDVLALRS